MKKISRNYICKLFALLAAVAMTVGLSACSSKKDTVKNVSVDSIAEKIYKDNNIKDMKVKGEAELKKFYGIDTKKLDGFKLYMAPSNIKAEEILVLKVKNQKDIDTIKDKINKRLDKLTYDFKDYLPKEYYYIKNKELEVKGNYVLLAISKYSSQIESTFDKSLK